jgi:hypothetical protein
MKCTLDPARELGLANASSFPNLMNSTDTDLWDYFGVGECDIPISEGSFDGNFGDLNTPVLS